MDNTPHQKKPSQGTAKDCSAKQSDPAGYTDGAQTHQLHQGATQNGKWTKTYAWNRCKTAFKHLFCGGHSSHTEWGQADGHHGVEPSKPDQSNTRAISGCDSSSTYGQPCSAVCSESGRSSKVAGTSTWCQTVITTLSPLHRYVFRSCLRNGGGGLGQFWPNILPVIRPHHLAFDLTFGSTLDLDTTLKRNALLASDPIRHYGRGYAQGLRYSERSPTLPIHPVFEVHTQIISHGVSICQ